MACQAWSSCFIGCIRGIDTVPKESTLNTSNGTEPFVMWWQYFIPMICASNWGYQEGFMSCPLFLPLKLMFFWRCHPFAKEGVQRPQFWCSLCGGSHVSWTSWRESGWIHCQCQECPGQRKWHTDTNTGSWKRRFRRCLHHLTGHVKLRQSTCSSTIMVQLVAIQDEFPIKMIKYSRYLYKIPFVVI